MCQDENVGTLIGSVYIELDNASQEGGDVSEIVEALNRIILAVDNGEITSSDLSDELNRLIYEANRIEAESISAGNTDLVFRVFVGGLSIVLSYITWRYLPVIYWRYYLRQRGDWGIQR